VGEFCTARGARVIVDADAHASTAAPTVQAIQVVARIGGVSEQNIQTKKQHLNTYAHIQRDYIYHFARDRLTQGERLLH